MRVEALKATPRGRLLAKATELQEPASKAFRAAAALLLLAQGRRDVTDLIDDGIDFCRLYKRDLDTLVREDVEAGPEFSPEYYKADEVLETDGELDEEDLSARIEAANRLQQFLQQVLADLHATRNIGEPEVTEASVFGKTLRGIAEQYQNRAGVALGEYRYGPRIRITK